MSTIRKIVPLTLMLPLIISYDFTRSLLSPVSDLGDAIATASARIETNVSGASHLGFDTYAYPGDAAMRAWRD